MNRATLIVLSFVIIACEEKHMENTKYRQELDQKKIVRITEGQLMDYASVAGKKMADSLQSIQSHKGINYLSTNARILYAKDIIRGSKEYDIFDAYSYALKMKQSFDDNVQKVDAHTFLFTRPFQNTDSALGILAIRLSRKSLIQSISNKDNK